MASPLDDVHELYEDAPCGLLSTLGDGTIVRVNRTLCSWLGYSADELVGRLRLADLLTMGGKLFHQTHWMPLLQMQGSVAELQLELLHRNGRPISVLVNSVQRTQGEILKHDLCVFVATDRRKYERELLLARKHAEELLARQREAEEAVRQREREFRTLAENSPDLIVRVDREYRVVYANPMAERFAGRNAQELLGCTSNHLGLLEELEEDWKGIIDAAFTGREAMLAFAHQSPPGEPRQLQALVVPERDAKGEIVSVLAITRDVTVLKRQEEQAHERAILAEQLVGIVSHDLRTPLNAVLLGASTLNSSELSTSHARVVARIISATLRANRLISDLLDFTQARLGGGLRVHPREIDLHALVAECTDEVKLAWPGRMVEHRRAGAGVGAADPDRLAQVISNLTSNALTYGLPDHPVTITSRVGERELELDVHNLGPVIPPALLPHIFEPLRRGEHQVKLGSRSVGLGLYIVREIALGHGGQVVVRSTEPEGTRFIVTLPRDGVGKSGPGQPVKEGG